MRVAGICGRCNKYYQGDSCPDCVHPVETVNVILDIPEHFNRGLGEVVRGRADYNAKLKERGLVEVGTEKSYVDPEIGRRNQERKVERGMYEIRPEAHKILNRYEEMSR